MFPCAGFLIFSRNKGRVVLVETHRNHLGFPKGKREKGERDIETALRELNEETGIRKEDIDILQNELEEFSDKNNRSVKYFIGILKKDYDNFVYDKEELLEVRWYETKDILELEKLKKRRKDIFLESLRYIFPKK